MASPPLLLLLLLLLFLLPSSTVAQPYANITLGSSLTAHNKDSFWSSLSGDFAFGFLQSGAGDYLLAIWFNKIVEKTVVWSANRNNLAPGGSTVQLTCRGKLVLNDPGGKQIWTANLAGSNQSVSYAAMLDTGNFVLAASDSEILWQSFDVPTDTILPSQAIIQGAILVARYSETNYSSGRFLLSMRSDGNLGLYRRAFPMDTIGKAYWETNTEGSGFQLVFNLSGSVYLIAKNKTILETLTSNTPSPQNFYHRAILEHDGVFRQYVYPKMDNGSDSSWFKAWSQVSNPTPWNICTSFIDGAGSGACGFNSYCRLGNDQRPYCTCPPGYDLLDPNDVMKGCKPTFVFQSCDESFPETDDFEFSALENTDWPQSYDLEHFQPVSEEWCRSQCLSDCFCAAAIFRNSDCWKKKYPLSFGKMDPGVGGRALVKIRKDNSTLKPNNPVEKDKTLLVIGSVLLGCSVFLIFIFLPAAFLIIYRFNKKKSMAVIGKPQVLGMNLRIFSYEELNKATNGFSDQLGSGAFATVYKGTIDSVDNNLVAVKKLDNVVKEGDQEFKAEVSAIARTNHKNLVRLLGFCNEEPHRMLVYEFMHNGSLADFLFGPSKPNWYQRTQVAIGTARGLCYLHEECSTQIIHCDIKPQNILLDDSLDARISDFGLAKLLKRNQTRTMTAIRGTKGYVAPEWFRSLPITVKVDVYSYGILLLEIICCRKSFEAKAENEDEMVLADWAYDCFKGRKVEKLVEIDEEAKNDLKRVKKLVMIAIWCIQEEPSLRPSMKKVVQMLEGAVEVSIPPDPSSFISLIQ